MPAHTMLRNDSRPSPAAVDRPLREIWRAFLAAGAAAVLLVFSAAGASAHVRVIPESTAAGGFTALTFRVPTESQTAGTVALRVHLPTDTPFTSVRTKSMPGWKAVVQRGPLPKPVQRDGATITEAATSVVWTADRGTQVDPGQFEEFAISVGPLPEAGTEVVLPVTQTYSDGKVVKWAQEPPANGAEPDLPAPVLVTTQGEEAHDAKGPSVAAGGQAQTAADAAGSSAGDTVATEDLTGRWLGGVGLALGAAALVVALVRRRPGSGPESA